MATLRDLIIGIRFEDRASREINRINDNLDETTNNARGAGRSTENLVKSFSEFGKIGLGAVTAVSGAATLLGGTILGVVAATSELNRDLARLKANASDNSFEMENMEEQLSKIVGVTGETDSAVETLSNLMQSGFKDSQMPALIDEINGAAIRFSDTLKTEGIADGIQETFATGEAIGMFGELLERSGVDLEVFNAGLAKAKQNGTEADYVLKQMQDLDLSSAYDEYVKLNPEIVENAEATHNFQVSMAELGKVLAPVATGLTNLATAGIEWIMNNETMQSVIQGVSGALSNTEGIMNTFNGALGWLKDNGQYIVAALAGIVAGIVAFNVINTAITLFKFFNAMMVAFRAGTVLATLAQWGFNAALLASPVTWVAVGIGLLVAAGVLLYKNWDTVKQKTVELWNKIKENPFVQLMIKMNPIIQAAKAIYENFDKIKAAFNRFKDAIKSFKLPGWVTSIGSTISSAASKLGGAVMGSHATGLAAVPFNGYTAELHAGESVLTASQSNALRNAGVLQSNSDGTPTVDMNAFRGGGGSSPTFNITINAAGGNAVDIKEAVKRGINEVMDSFSRTNPQVTLR